MDGLASGLIVAGISSVATLLFASERARAWFITLSVVLGLLVAGAVGLWHGNGAVVADNSKAGLDASNPQFEPLGRGGEDRHPSNHSDDGNGKPQRTPIDAPDLADLPPAVAAEVLAIRSKGSRLSDGRFVHVALVKFVRVGNQVWSVGSMGAELVQPEVELPAPGVIPEV